MTAPAVSLRFLGTGCGFPAARRAHTSTWMETGSTRLLIDAGEPCSQLLMAGGLDPLALDAVLLTHAHADHIGGLPMLLQTLWLAGRRRRLPVFLPGSLARPLLAWLEAIYLPPRLLGFDLVLVPWERRRTHRIGACIVAPARTTHLDHLRRLLGAARPARYRSYGIDCRVPGRRIIFSGDIGAAADLDPHFARPIDVLVCELAHFPPDTLFAALDGHAIGHLFLTHLAPEIAADIPALRRAARRALPDIGKIRVPRDGAIFRLQ